MFNRIFVLLISNFELIFTSDAFDVISQDAPNNYYMKYSGDKGKHSRSTLIVKKPYGSYYFIPVDGTLIPGPRRPFNFMGDYIIY